MCQRLRRAAILLGTTHVRAALNPVAAGASVLCRSETGEILLVRSRLAGGWSLPGGAIDRGEAPEAAALRELHEETGHQGGSPPRFFGLYTRRTGLVTNLIAVYLVEGGEIAFKPGFEIVEAGWFAPAALPALTQAGTRRRIAELTDSAPQSPFW